VHGHGSPYHNLTLDQAGEYFRDTYEGGRMVKLWGLLPTPEQLARLGLTPPNLNLSEAERKEVGNIDVHGGFDETSRLEPRTTNSPAEFFNVGRAANRLGYQSSPRLASASYGARLQQYRAAKDAALALAILGGTVDERDIPRYSSRMTGDEQIRAGLADSTKNELERERRQREWPRKKGIE
jgi:hypothetical protein